MSIPKNNSGPLSPRIKSPNWSSSIRSRSNTETNLNNNNGNTNNNKKLDPPEINITVDKSIANTNTNNPISNNGNLADQKLNKIRKPSISLHTSGIEHVSSTTSANHRRTQSNLSTHSRNKSNSLPLNPNFTPNKKLSIVTDQNNEQNFKENLSPSSLGSPLKSQQQDFDLDNFINENTNSPLNFISGNHNITVNNVSIENLKSPIRKLSFNGSKHNSYIENIDNIDNIDSIDNNDNDNDSNDYFHDDDTIKDFQISDSKSSNFISKWYYILKQKYPNFGITIISIVSWYCFSMSISVYNRWMFSSSSLDFKFPIIITSFHQLILFILSLVTLLIFPNFRLNYDINYHLTHSKESSLNLNNSSTSEDSDLQFNNDNGKVTDNESDIDIGENGYPNANKLTYLMPVKEYFLRILPCSIASAGDIGLGNTSFRFITLSLYTMVKTSSLVFVLLWGVLFKLEKMTWRILSIVLIMTCGVGMMIWGQHDPNSDILSNSISVSSSSSSALQSTSTSLINLDTSGVFNTDNHSNNNDGAEFLQYGQVIDDEPVSDEQDSIKLIKNLVRKSTESGIIKPAHLIVLGVTLVLMSSCMSGLRWALTQIMLKKNKRTKNPILTMMYLSPAMCVILFIFGLIVEGIVNFTNAEIWELKGFLTTCILILIPGFLAFFMTISEYVLLQHASLLTLSIAGIFKELLTIFVSWIVFGDRLKFINIIGLAVTFADIIWYNIYRFQQTDEHGGKIDDNEFVDIELNSMTK